MAKVTIHTSNFTAGVISPRLRGRTELDKYNSSLLEGVNAIVLRHGGFTIRPPFKFLGRCHDMAHNVRLVPFSFTRDQSYMLELGHQYLRVWKADALIEASEDTPYLLDTPYLGEQLADIDVSQSMDTLILTHQQHATRRLLRFEDARWTLSTAPFNPGALSEIGHRGAMAMSISDVTAGTGRTLTAGANFFKASDVGRQITWAGGIASITAVASQTSATATVEVPFSNANAAANDWILEGTPQATLTPSTGTKDKGVGESTTLTLGSAGWRSEDVGRWVEFSQGSAKIVAVSSETVASAIITAKISFDNAVPADSWVLRGPLWNEHDGFPATCTFHDQRLWLGNTKRYPQSVWGSRTALYFDFAPGVADDSGVYRTVSSNERNPIEYLHSGSGLLILTADAEFEGRGGVEKPITHTNMQLPMLTRWGCGSVRPVQIGTEVLFLQGGGQVLRRMLPAAGGYESNEASVFSEHFFRPGIVGMTFQKVPESVLYLVRADGKVVSMTYSSEQNVYACTLLETQGHIESMATVPVGKEERTYAVVRRKVNGVDVRNIERVDWGDSWLLHDQVSTPLDSFVRLDDEVGMATWGGLEHLEGCTVKVVADGINQGEFEVQGGELTLKRTAKTVVVGLPYVMNALSPEPEVNTPTGSSQSKMTQTSRVAIRLLASIGGSVQVSSQSPEEDLAYRRFDTNILDNPVPAFTGVKDVTGGSFGTDGDGVRIFQRDPYPICVLSISREITVNG